MFITVQVFRDKNLISLFLLSADSLHKALLSFIEHAVFEKHTEHEKKMFLRIFCLTILRLFSAVQSFTVSKWYSLQYSPVQMSLLFFIFLKKNEFVVIVCYISDF